MFLAFIKNVHSTVTRGSNPSSGSAVQNPASRSALPQLPSCSGWTGCPLGHAVCYCCIPPWLSPRSPSLRPPPPVPNTVNTTQSPRETLGHWVLSVMGIIQQSSTSTTHNHSAHFAHLPQVSIGSLDLTHRHKHYAIMHLHLHHHTTPHHTHRNTKLFCQLAAVDGYRLLRWVL